jgi:NAD(P)-dependent dehydrogenase (short-subunit alcohol dehydrogenase family)
MADGAVVIVGGTAGLGRELAQDFADRGREVIVSGRDAGRAEAAANEIGGNTTGIAFDLADPHCIADALSGVGTVDHIALVAIERDVNTVREYDIQKAIRLATLKLVGYTEVVHVLAPRLTATASILLFGGQALRRPYPGSTTITTVNGGVEGLVRTLAVQLAPIRVNAIHPGVVGDTPEWEGKPPELLENVRARTPLGRLVTIDDVVDACIFLLENGAVNGVNLELDGGWLLQ